MGTPLRLATGPLLTAALLAGSDAPGLAAPVPALPLSALTVSATAAGAVAAGRCGDPAAAGDPGPWLVADASRPGGGGSCGGSRASDRCLVGTWRQSGGGPVEHLRRTLPPEIFDRIASSAQQMVFHADGRFESGIASASIGAASRGVRYDGQGRFNSSGRWSANGDTLTFCPDVQDVRGRIEIQAGDERGTMAVPPAPARPTVSTYSCSATSLTTHVPMGRSGGTMSTTFSRVTGP